MDSDPKGLNEPPRIGPGPTRPPALGSSTSVWVFPCPNWVFPCPLLCLCGESVVFTILKHKFWDHNTLQTCKVPHCGTTFGTDVERTSLEQPPRGLHSTLQGLHSTPWGLHSTLQGLHSTQRGAAFYTTGAAFYTTCVVFYATGAVFYTTLGLHFAPQGLRSVYNGYIISSESGCSTPQGLHSTPWGNGNCCPGLVPHPSGGVLPDVRNTKEYMEIRTMKCEEMRGNTKNCDEI